MEGSEGGRKGGGRSALGTGVYGAGERQYPDSVDPVKRAEWGIENVRYRDAQRVRQTSD